MAPVEKLFSYIKQGNLNPMNRTFTSRSNPRHDLEWLALEIRSKQEPNSVRMYMNSLKVAEDFLVLSDA
jgi:hypothetical protein